VFSTSRLWFEGARQLWIVHGTTRLPIAIGKSCNQEKN
jgi:hypothetical protein